MQPSRFSRSWAWFSDRIRTIRFQDVLTLLVAVSLALTTYLSYDNNKLNSALEREVARNELRSKLVLDVQCAQKEDLAQNIESTERILELPNAAELLEQFGYTLVEAKRDLADERKRLAVYAELDCAI